MKPLDVVYKVFRAAEAASLIASGSFDGSADDMRDGFIHLSTGEQVEQTLFRHFRDKSMLFLGICGVNRFGDALRMEASSGGTLYPHLYRPLLVPDLIAIVPIPDEREGWGAPVIDLAL